MSKYIDAEKIPWTDLNDGRGGVNVYVTFLEKVARMPSADVVEVVRCKDCVNWKDIFPYPTCELLSGHWEEDMYCSYGERKE